MFLAQLWQTRMGRKCGHLRAEDSTQMAQPPSLCEDRYECTLMIKNNGSHTAKQEMEIDEEVDMKFDAKAEVEIEVGMESRGIGDRDVHLSLDLLLTSPCSEDVRLERDQTYESRARTRRHGEGILRLPRHRCTGTTSAHVPAYVNDICLYFSSSSSHQCSISLSL